MLLGSVVSIESPLLYLATNGHKRKESEEQRHNQRRHELAVDHNTAESCKVESEEAADESATLTKIFYADT